MLTDRAYTKRLVAVQTMYVGSSTEGPSPLEVVSWIEGVDAALGDPTMFVPPLSVMVVAISLDVAPVDLRTGASYGFYRPDTQVIWLAAHAASQALLAHELGHHVTSRRPEGLAEAFRSVFGAPSRPHPGGQDFWRAAVRMAGGK